MHLKHKSIFDSFGPFFDHFGFTKLPAYSQYRKNDESGFNCIIFSFSGDSSAHTLEIHAGRRIDSVESFAQKYLENFSDFHSHSMTMLASQGRLSGKKYIRYDVSDGLSNAIRSRVEKFIMQDAFSRQKDWGDIQTLNTVYNEDPFNMDLFYNIFNKAVRGCILNRFSGDIHYNQLKEAYRSILIKNHVPESQMMAFQRLTGFLDIYSPN
jgi:hypothetical protein